MAVAGTLVKPLSLSFTAYPLYARNGGIVAQGVDQGT
jgi:hypothetical protein